MSSNYVRKTKPKPISEKYKDMKEVQKRARQRRAHVPTPKQIKIGKMGLEKGTKDFLNQDEIELPERVSRPSQPDRYRGTIFDATWGGLSKGLPIMVVDRIMGAGKTTAVINFINDLPNSVHFIYVAPYLSEVGRIIVNCIDKKFCTPMTQNSKGTKKQGFIELLEQEQNIVCSHALFHTFDKECIELAKLKNYVLIMDEVANVVEEIDVNPTDLQLILGRDADGKKFSSKKLAHVDEETCQLIWDDDTYNATGKLYEYKKQAELGSIFVYKNNVFVWSFPVEIFKAFSQVFILTYLFEGQIQCSYYKFFGVDYRYIHIDNSDGDSNFIPRLFDKPQTDDLSLYKKLIHIEEREKYNEACWSDFITYAEREKLFSKAWFSKHEEDVDTLRKRLNTWFNSAYKDVGSEFKMYTTFKSARPALESKGFVKQFVELNSRATNKFKDRYILAYMCNRYLNPVIKNFFHQKGVTMDEDKFALSEMLQWIFRSRVREGKEIWIYIPSQRMRRLLKEWMNGKID